MNQKGFTLVELLVVVAIISLLSSTVLASISGARQQAKITSYRQDIRQIKTAIQLYRNDHSGQFPPADGGYSFGSTNTEENWSEDYMATWPESPWSGVNYNFSSWQDWNSASQRVYDYSISLDQEPVTKYGSGIADEIDEKFDDGDDKRGRIQRGNYRIQYGVSLQ